MKDSSRESSVVAALLGDVERRRAGAVDELMGLVYEDLRRLAASLLRKERSGHTLQATALVHEVYLDLVGQRRVDWKGKTHFYRVASMAMRRFLAEYARNRGRKKRGGGRVRLTLSLASGLGGDGDFYLVDVADAFERLAGSDERSARVAEMKVFGGLTHAQVAEALGISADTVKSDWRFARAYLIDALGVV